jgi:hypothetical protein
MIKNKCKDVIGTGNCSYAIYLPWKVSFNGRKIKCVAIDKCLLPEILQLWEQGIKTTGCCCGHDKLKPYIGVREDCIDKMKTLGYEVQFNPHNPEGEDSFAPKTKLEYGINKNNGEWEVENE